MKALVLAIGACAALLAAGCGGSGNSTESTGSTGSTASSKTSEASVATKPAAKVKGPEPKVHLPPGPPPKKLVVKDLKIGRGREAKAGDELTTQFVADFITGKQLESSWEEGNRPFSFHLGANESSPGWERGLRGMRVGGRRELIIPPLLTSRFGVPPSSRGPEHTLVYVVDLLAVTPP